MPDLKQFRSRAKSNRKLADRFGDARKSLQLLTEEIESLRHEILQTGKKRLAGDDYLVEVKRKDVNRFVVAKAKALLTASQIGRCGEKSPTDFVYVSSIDSTRKADFHIDEEERPEQAPI